MKFRKKILCHGLKEARSEWPSGLKRGARPRFEPAATFVKVLEN